jgi:serine/threonine protein kinase
MSDVHPGRRLVGRYELGDEIAAGGMATVHVGRLVGPVGFSRTVAVKRLHPQFAKDPQFVAMFVDEARLAACVRHPNVVSTIDVVAIDGEVFLIMEYIQGESLARLQTSVAEGGSSIPVPIAVAISTGILDGLHAAHEAKSEHGAPLDIVHRDVSPQNVLIGVDGVPRVLDFGVAKAQSRLQTTQEGQIKGKVPYMSPEQLNGEPLDRRSDVYAAAVVTWETLAGRRLFASDSTGGLMGLILKHRIDPPSQFNSVVPGSLDAIVLKGLAFVARERFATAHEMALELEQALRPATPREVGVWVRSTAKDALLQRAETIARGASGSVVTEIVSAGAVPRESLRSRDAGPITSLSTATPNSLRQAQRSDGRWWMLVAAIVASGVLSTLLLRRVDRAPATTNGVELTPSAQSIELPSVAATEPADPMPSSGVPATSSATPQRAPGRVVPKHSPRAECNPPYTIDADGVKVFKPRCLY